MDSDHDEVDAFHSNREKVFLDAAGSYGKNSDVLSEEDEEVMEISDGEDDDGEEDGVEDDGEGDEEEEDEEDDEDEDREDGWGGRNNYYGGDDDDANDEMAEEARRQQKKHLQELAMDDYVDEDMVEGWKSVAADEEKQKNLSIEARVGGSLQTLSSLDQRKLLTESFPEFVPLLSEMTKLQPTLLVVEKLPGAAAAAKTTALRAYLGCLASYFALFVEKLKQDEVFSMKDEPIMENILGCREIWRQASELPDIEEEEEAEDDEKAEKAMHKDEDDVTEALASPSQVEAVSQSESDSNSDSDSFVDAQEHLPLHIDINSRRDIASSSAAPQDDFTEGADDVDMEDKQRRKRTLRFYTSKIDQAAAKANKERFTGDIDVPYKERLYERQQRLLEEARKRGLELKDIGQDLDNEDFGSEDEATAQQVNDNELYEQVAQQKKNKKAARKSAHQSAVAAAKEGKLQELQESLGEDGKRAINYQILKNRGLTAHKKKDNRNTRVKKRKKYEQAQKKLKSVRQVYKGSLGPYEGEKTGIKKGLSRSVKLV